MAGGGRRRSDRAGMTSRSRVQGLRGRVHGFICICVSAMPHCVM